MVAIAQTSAAAAASAGKYLALALGREHYAIEILKVKEIIGLLPITRVPRMPPHVKGVINLRGQVISVLDLRLRLGLESTEPTEQTCIIVVESACTDRKLSTGLIVDRVLEVLKVPQDAIVPCPEFGQAIDGTFILGMAKTSDSVKILLDIDAVLKQASDRSK
jgi:purine-binding chemotaxis protein CheW